MLNAEQRKQVTSILDAADDLTIATNRPDGYPQATVVSFVNDGTAIYFGTWSRSQKASNIARDPRVSVTVTDPYKDWNGIRGVSIGGRARRLTDAAELEKVTSIMFRKFPQIAQFAGAMPASEMAMFCVEAEVISILDYSKGFGHTEFATT